MSDHAFSDFLRVCFPLLSRSDLTTDVIVRADWNPETLMGWMVGEARSLDLRGDLREVRAPALVLAGEDDAWAPLGSVREVVDALGGETVFRSFPGARHSIFLDAPAAYEELGRFLAGLDAGDAE